MKKGFGKLAAVMAIGLSAVLFVTACGKNEEAVPQVKRNENAGNLDNEDKSIRVFFPDTIQTDNALVSEEVSKMSKEKIGVEVEMVFFGSGEYSTKLPKLMATNEKMDIGWDGSDTFVSRARDGAYYDISGDLWAFPGLDELFEEKFLGGVTVDGGVYGIPTLKEMANNWVWYIDKPTLDRHPEIDVDKIDTMADLEPLLAILKEEGRLGLGCGNDGSHVAFDLEEHYDTITGAFVVSNDTKEKLEDKKVVNYYETQEFEDYVRLLNKWFNEGYIINDVLLNGWDTYLKKTEVDPTLWGLSFVCYSPLNEVARSKGSKIGEQIPIHITDPVISNSSTRGSVSVIYEKSTNKQSSLKFLELWNTDKEMNRLIKYGIEGKHYNLVDEDGTKKIQKVDGAGSMYGVQNWRTGNMLLGNLEVGEPVNKVEVFNEWNESARDSVVLGFVPDISGLEGKIAACGDVVKTKMAPLLSGAIDPDDPQLGIKAAVAELKKAGSADIITELQTQYLEWVKNK